MQIKLPSDRTIACAIVLFIAACAGALAIDAQWPRYLVLAAVIWLAWGLGIYAGRS